MMTPLGALESLDLKDPKICFDILSYDKHQVAEGMVVESLFDQIIERIPAAVGGEEVHILDVDTFVVRNPKAFRQGYAFVLSWKGRKQVGLKRYLAALGKIFTTYQVEFIDGLGFRARLVREGRPASDWELLEVLLGTLSVRSSKSYTVDSQIRKQERQLASFWGYLHDTYGDRLAEKVAVPRLLVNWGIQPWFRSVWNIDRVFLVDDSLWVLEAKHKFPYEHSGKLQFGLNNGEAYLIRDLINCGINVIHSIVVKPYWDMNVGSSYLISNYNARQSAMVVGRTVDKAGIEQILRSASAHSPGHTTMTGDGKLNYKPLAASDFALLSNLADPDAVANGIAQLLDGSIDIQCVDEKLRAARIG
ncbi:hypothetical protein QCD79_22270 [Pseudomonas quasicaspiana]|nr:hypothetical protein [Pseudomonas syringae]MDG6402739.1 hypothetical protein [Pseudomonas quasicaspiana]